MPRGGPRFPTGRRPGSKNKATIERELRAAEERERELQDAKAGRRKLGKDVLEECMNVMLGVTAIYQPLPPGTDQAAAAAAGRTPDFEKFARCMDLTLFAAKSLADFQSPKFRAIAVSAAPDQTGDGAALPQRKPEDAKPVDAKVVDLNDNAALTRVYQKMIAAGGS